MHLPQNQAVRRRGHPCPRAVARFENIANIARLELAAPHLHQRPDDAPAHLVQETVALDDPHQHRLFPIEFARGHGADRRAHLVFALDGERAKVPLADEVFRPALHSLEIQLARHMPRGVVLQWIHHRMIPDGVTVLLAAGIESGMKRHRHPLGLNHPNVARQKGVQGQAQFALLDPVFHLRHLHVRHHAARVHAGVSAARTVYPLDAREQATQRLLDPLLDGHAVFLHLPPFVAGAVVGDCQLQFQVIHGAQASPSR